MFSQSVLSAHYLDISCIYMLLTFFFTASYLRFSSVRAKYPSITKFFLRKKYALSRNVFINNSDIFPKNDIVL